MGGRAGAVLSRERRDRSGRRCDTTRPGPVVADGVEVMTVEVMTVEAMTVEAMTVEDMTVEALP
jgi:energy-converting hydrogenase Eha subunit A